MEVVDAVDFDAVDEAGLGEVGGGDEDAPDLVLLGGFDDVDDAWDGADFAVQGEFADEEGIGEVFREELAGEGEDADGDGEVEVGAVFLEVGGGEVDGDFLGGEGEVAVYDGAADALAGLGDGFVGHADNVESGEAAVGVAFDFNDATFVALGD